jgi:hypothetical protein
MITTNQYKAADRAVDDLARVNIVVSPRAITAGLQSLKKGDPPGFVIREIAKHCHCTVEELTIVRYVVNALHAQH